MFATRKGAAKLTLVVVIALVGLKIAVAIVTGSLSVLAQAVDSFLDLFAVAIIFFAVGIAARPADESHPFGHGKVEAIAAVGQAMLILTAGGFIIYSAVQRIISGVSLELTEAGIAVMLVSMIASIFLSRHLLRVSRATDSIALHSTARNISADVYSAAAVLAGLIAVRLTGLSILDPIIALLVVLFILKAAYDVLRIAFGELTDTRLSEAEENAIRSCFQKHESEIVSFHKLRTRRAGSQRHVDFHLVISRHATVEQAHQTCDRLETEIKTGLPDTSINIHVEPCSPRCDQCPLSCKEAPDETLG